MPKYVKKPRIIFSIFSNHAYKPSLHASCTLHKHVHSSSWNRLQEFSWSLSRIKLTNNILRSSFLQSRFFFGAMPKDIILILLNVICSISYFLAYNGFDFAKEWSMKDKVNKGCLEQVRFRVYNKVMNKWIKDAWSSKLCERFCKQHYKAKAPSNSLICHEVERFRRDYISFKKSPFALECQPMSALIMWFRIQN